MQQHLSACLLDGRKDEDIIKEFMFDLFVFLDTLHSRNESFKYLNPKNLFVDGNGEVLHNSAILITAAEISFSLSLGILQENEEDKECNRRGRNV